MKPDSRIHYLTGPKLLIAAILCFAAALFAAQWLWPQSTSQQIQPLCDQTLTAHVYNPQRLKVFGACVSVTGTVVDATHGKRKQGCRSEPDGDLHCWLKLDRGQERYLNVMNTKNEGGALVFEPMCQHRVTQKDAMAACKDWHQDIVLPPVGSHVRITGAWVLDTEHGHEEIHPVTKIETIP